MLPPTSALKPAIRTVLREYSGGLKHVEFAIELVKIFGAEISGDGDKIMDELEEFVRREMPEVGILKYVQDLGKNDYREKLFFYTRIPSPVPSEG